MNRNLRCPTNSGQILRAIRLRAGKGYRVPFIRNYPSFIVSIDFSNATQTSKNACPQGLVFNINTERMGTF